MNQKQKIFNLLAKTGKTQMSKSRNVKFSLADDLTTAYTEAEIAARNISEGIELAYETVSEAIMGVPAPESFFEDIDAAAMQLNAVLSEARSGAEQLGIDPRDIPGFSEAEDSMNTLEAVREAAARYEDDMIPILSGLKF